MSSWEFAPKFTRVTFSSSSDSVTIADGEAIRVWGVWITNLGSNVATNVKIANALGQTFFDHEFNSLNTYEADIAFTSSNGLVVSVDGAGFADFEVTIFHSQAGS